MKILVACEVSQAVTKEFRKLGHEAYSCDISPCTGWKPEWHLQQDVTPLLKEKYWDMIIAFPPCTHLAVSGAKWFKGKMKDGRMQAGIDFFKIFTRLSHKRVAIENPVGIMSTLYRKPDQIIQPYMFGDPMTKTTCLWLKGLPMLKPTKYVYRGDISATRTGTRRASWDNNLASDKYRAAIRAKTFPGVAKAMAEQWGVTI